MTLTNKQAAFVSEYLKDKNAKEICDLLSRGDDISPPLSLGGDESINIYVLVDPRDRRVRYVGRTRKPATRHAQHCRLSNCRGRNRRAAWLRSLLSSGHAPEMHIVSIGGDWDRSEEECIAAFAAAGCDLVNGNRGGRDGSHMRRAKTSPNKTGRWSPLHRAMQTLSEGGKNSEIVIRVRRSIERAIAREGKSAALARINAELAYRRPWLVHG